MKKIFVFGTLFIIILTVALLFMKNFENNKKIEVIEESAKIAKDISNFWNSGDYKKSINEEVFIDKSGYTKYSQYAQTLQSVLDSEKFYISEYTKNKLDDSIDSLPTMSIDIPEGYKGDKTKYTEEKIKELKSNPVYTEAQTIQRTHDNDDPRIQYDKQEDKYYILSKDLDFTDGFDIVDYLDSSFEIKPEDTPMNYDYIIKNSNRHYNYVSQNTKEVDDHTEITYFYKDTINKDNHLKITVSFNKKGIIDFDVKY